MKILRFLAPLLLLAATAFGQVSMTQASGTYTDKGLAVRSGTYNKYIDATGLTYDTATGALTAASFIGAVTGNASTATALATGRTLAITGDLAYTSPSFNGSANVTAAGTLATVNGNVGSFGSSTSIPSFTVNAKGLVTAASGNVVIAPAGTLTGTTLASNVTASSLTSAAGGTFNTGAFNAVVAGANPTASIGLTAVNGAASTFLRSDGAPALDQSIAPTWTGTHQFNAVSPIKVGSTATSGFQLYNTTDQTTNYERFEFLWLTNALELRTVLGGTGTARNLKLSAANGAIMIMRVPNVGGSFQFDAPASSLASQIGWRFSGNANTATSGTCIGLSVTTNYTQASGNAANTDLLVNRTQTNVGSGIQRLIDLQVGGTTMFAVDNIGGLTLSKTVTATGTTGAQTINKASGSVNFAAAATSLVVTNSLVTANSIIVATVATNDTTMTNVTAVAAAGSFTLRSQPSAPTGEVRVNFIITN
jgi:hypothetical protein